jgi:D-glycerate 3-kinase
MILESVSEAERQASVEVLRAEVVGGKLESFLLDLAERAAIPLVFSLESQRSSAPRFVDAPLVVAVSGLPGSGKSTLVRLLHILWQAQFGGRVATFSLDDLYLPGREREALAGSSHPLFRTRGAPGTHDVALGLEVLDSLCNARGGDQTALPRFDKGTDEPRPRADWPRFSGRPDVILVDGWCWGSKAAPEKSLVKPINSRERNEDADGTWRRNVNDRLAGDYQNLFSRAHVLVELLAPSFERSVEWRKQQERDLIQLPQELRPAAQSAEDIEAFLELFERVARFCPKYEADFTIRLGDSHEVIEVLWAPPGFQ